MKLGVITDGISRDLEHALQVMKEFNVEYGDLQFVWDKEIGDQTPEEIQKIKALLTQYNVKVPCITRHNFVGLPIKTTEPEDEAYQKHFEGLKRCITIAKELGTDMVRVMSGRKEMIIFGHNGAEKWVASTGSWDKLLKLMEAPATLHQALVFDERFALDGRPGLAQQVAELEAARTIDVVLEAVLAELEIGW